MAAYGTGGRLVRTDVGDGWDHFVVIYWFPGEVKVDFSSTQCIKGYNDICSRIYGADGTAEMHDYASTAITGAKPWQGPEKLDTHRQGTLNNIRAFVESIRSGKFLNNGEETARSNPTAILGRMAAYRNARVSWDEMMRSEEKLDLRLSRLG